ncbi:MAG: phospholipid carrier-dependent glycosyltransferase [Planctomycetota bacterium]|nr:phospholipid carrier-dependent glycosyltransferase [Planctomycetota bacterium]
MILMDWLWVAMGGIRCPGGSALLRSSPMDDSDPIPTRQGRVAACFGLMLLYALQLWSVSQWLEKDRRPMITDQSKHFQHALKTAYFIDHPDLPLRKVVEEGGESSSGGLRRVLSWLASPVTGYIAWVRGANVASRYPPLVYFVPAPAVLASDGDPDAVRFFTAMVFLAMLAWGTYRMGAHFGGPGTGFLSGGLVLALPSVHDLSVAFLLDLPLMALTACSLASLVAVDGFKNRRASLSFGVWMGIGLLVKQVLPVFLGGAFLMQAWPAWKSRKMNPVSMRNLFLALAVAILIGGVFHIPHSFDSVVHLFYVDHGGTMEGDAGRGDWQGYLVYAIGLVEQAGAVPAVLFGFALVPFLIRGARSARVLLASYFLAYLFFSLLSNKDFRYTAPLLPLVSVVCASALTLWLPGKVRAVVGGILLLGLHGLLVAPWMGHEIPTKTHRWKTHLSDGRTHEFEVRWPLTWSRPQTGNWRLNEIRQAIHDRIEKPEKVRVGVVEPVFEIVHGLKRLEYRSYLRRRYEKRRELIQLDVDRDVLGGERFVIRIENYRLYDFYREIYEGNSRRWESMADRYRRIAVFEIPKGQKAEVWERIGSR